MVKSRSTAGDCAAGTTGTGALKPLIGLKIGGVGH